MRRSARSTALSLARSLLAALALMAFAGCGDDEPAAEAEAPGPPAVELVPIPRPDLSALDPLVAERIVARRAWQRAIDEAPEVEAAARAEAYGELGNLYHAYRLLPSAAAAYENARRLAPEDPRWPYYLGQLARTQNRDEQAIEALRDSLELDPGHVAARVRLGEVLLDQNRPDEAEEQLARALELDPDATAALFGLAQIAAGRDDAERAVELFERVLELDPDATAVYFPLSLAYRRLGDEAAAERRLTLGGEGEVALDDPLMARLYQLSEGYREAQAEGGEAFSRGDYPAAEPAFRRAVAFDPLAVTARLNLASALLELERPAEAAEQLEVALKLAPGHPAASRELAALRLAEGRRREAIPLLSAVLADQPEDHDVRLALALALEESGAFDQALTAYERVLAAEPERLTAVLGRASTLLRLERYAEARAALERAYAASIERGRPSGDLANALARVLATAPEATVRDGARALELAGELFAARADAEHAETLAMALAETGDFQSAMRLQEALVARAREAGAEPLAEHYAAGLADYRQGQPARAPWNRRLPPPRAASPAAPGSAPP